MYRNKIKGHVMNRHSLVFIVVGFALIPFAIRGQESSPEKRAKPESNRVYVKVVMPADSTDRDKNRPVIESWIAKEIKEREQSRFTAVTGWVPLNLAPLEATHVWNGTLGEQSHCPVSADIERIKRQFININFSGWSPGGAFLTIAVKDEPGSRVVAAVEDLKSEQGSPYVAVLIVPPMEKSATPIK